MSKDIYTIKVDSRASFVEFINLLRQDYKNAPEEWENDTLDNFFEAMSRYAEGVQGYYDNTGQNVNADLPSWKTFADIMRGAKIYE